MNTNLQGLRLGFGTRNGSMESHLHGMPRQAPAKVQELCRRSARERGWGDAYRVPKIVLNYGI